MAESKNLLFLSDNDMTVFDTFRPGPSGYGVAEAYDQALIDIFGEKALLILKESGLQNRAPGQVVELIFRKGKAEEFTQNAKCFFDKDERYKLADLVPKGKGCELIWDENNLMPLFTELLVRVKLSYLMKNIGMKNSDGTTWPEMFPGVSEFLETLKDYGTFGIISSGHDIFIQKSFELYGIPYPKISITDDDLRGYESGSAKQLVKPDPRLIQMAVSQHQNCYGALNIIYTGDDIAKDGQMAINAGVPFIHFAHTNTKHWYEIKRDLVVGNTPFI